VSLNCSTVGLCAKPQDDPTQVPFKAGLYRDIAFCSLPVAVEACHEAFNFDIFERCNFAKLSCRLLNKLNAVIAKNYS